MAVSIINRPNGYTIGTVVNTIGSVTDNGSGDAVFNITGHGYSNGNTVYIKSTVSQYNGMFTVSVGNANQFRIISIYNGVDFIGFINDASGTVTQMINSHDWNCVHLPIMYKISNTAWPTNSINTVRTISSVTNTNGYCDITASGDTNVSAALEFVKITNAGALSGVYQVKTFASNTSFTIDLAYSSANDTALTGASIQYYYNNYYLSIKIYGGLPAGHTHEAQKPSGYITEIKSLPDSDNVSTIYINEIIKTKINALSNNTLLGTLPNNIDFWTSFYIQVAETYDVVSSGRLTTFTSSYTDDIGNLFYAANAKLPFKNIHSGSLSDYIMNEDSPGKFLTLFEEPVIFNGYYYDISFIDPVGTEGDSGLEINGVLNTINYGTDGPGLYRYSIDGSECEDLEVALRRPQEYGEDIINGSTGFSDDGLTTKWLIAPYELSGKGIQSDSFPGLIPRDETIDITLNVSSGALQNVTVDLIDGSGSTIQTVNFGDISAGLNTQTVTTNAFPAPITASVRINAQASNTALTGSITAITIIKDQPSVSVPDSSFDTGSPWSNQGTGLGGGTATWSFGGGEAIASSTGLGTEIARSGSFTALPSGTVVSGTITHNFESGIFGTLKVYLWNGSVRETLLSTSILGTGADVVFPIPNYTTTNSNNTHVEFEFQRSSGSGFIRIKDISLVTGLATDYSPSNNTFTGSTGWSQVGSGYDWVFSGGVVTLTVPSARFGLDFLNIGDSGRAKRTGLTIPAGTYRMPYIFEGDASVTFGFYNGVTLVHSFGVTFTGTGASTINNINIPSSCDTITITATGSDADIFEFLALSMQEVLAPDYISEIKTIRVNCECYNQGIYITWLNYLGGFDYWLFTAEKEYQIDITDSQTLTNDIATDWPNSYGEFADTIEQQIYRNSKDAILLRSQILTLSQLNAIKHIKTSPLVQIMEDRYNRRTVIVDKDSFKVYDEGDKIYSIQFKVTYTNEIPSQTL